MTFFGDLIYFGLVVLIMLGLLGVMSAAILGGSLSVKRTSTGSHVVNDVVLWFSIGLIVVVILQTLLAGLEAKWLSLVTVVIRGLLAVAAAIGDLLPVKKTFTSSDVLSPIAFWLSVGLIVVVILRGLLLTAEAKWFGLVILGILGLLAVAAAIGSSLPAKRTLTRRHLVKATPERLWAALSERLDWVAGFAGYEELPPKNGHRMWVQHYEPPFSKTTWEEVESDPPDRLMKRTPDGRYCVTYLVEPVCEGSRLTITDNQALNPIDRFIEQYLPRKIDGYLQDEDRRLRILVEHYIYPGRADLTEAGLVWRENRGL